MYEKLDAPENVWAIRLSGDLDRADIDAIYADLDGLLKSQRSIGAVVDFEGFNDASRDAVAADIRHELGLLGNLMQFRRLAVLTDKTWLGYIFERLDPIVPTLDIRIFPFGSAPEAIDWAADI
ncbi:STAS/SEC14 domain-containing protein [Jannaschia rubra]|uniref:SpoIIAA-like protein n=1 Tax=Jannaschia rubra TaxID=282197 RepID=A0A0M6XPS6_9RHOB|nr:STAS/SEC14 domain-containing protein [Jannaschia rubra]CTQ32024.1 hypothetical protein JAN5088_00783 [Jannaschia rubra]SFG39576.1 SpoIIAA-like [Jannaschia rubra]